MNVSGSGPSRGGSKLKASTAASQRRASIPEVARVYNYASGGSIMLPLSRRAEANSKNERKKLAKELGTARKMAHEGMNVEFTPHGAGKHDIFVNGVPAELKKVESAGQIIPHGKKAVRSQGAKQVYFDFVKFTKEHRKRITILANVHNIHGRFYIPGKKKSEPF